MNCKAETTYPATFISLHAMLIEASAGLFVILGSVLDFSRDGKLWARKAGQSDDAKYLHAELQKTAPGLSAEKSLLGNPHTSNRKRFCQKT